MASVSPKVCRLVIGVNHRIFKMTETKIYDTEYNVGSVRVPTQQGKLVVWPSYLYHETQKNSSDERYTISFNTLDKSYLNAIKE